MKAKVVLAEGLCGANDAVYVNGTKVIESLCLTAEDVLKVLGELDIIEFKYVSVDLHLDGSMPQVVEDLDGIIVTDV